MVKTKYQLILDKMEKPRAIELLFDRNQSLLSLPFSQSLEIIDNLCIREHIHNLKEFVENAEKETIKILNQLSLHVNIFPDTILKTHILSDSYFVSLLKTLPFQSIVFEILERGIEGNNPVEIFTKIKEADFLVAIDDYGCGGMSREVLHLHLIDIVKIDYSVFANDRNSLFYLTQKLKENGKTVILEKAFCPEHLFIDMFQTFELHLPNSLDNLEKELRQWRIT